MEQSKIIYTLETYQYSKDISEVHRKFYKSTNDHPIPAWCIKEKEKINTKYTPRIYAYHVMNKNIAPSKIIDDR